MICVYKEYPLSNEGGKVGIDQSRDFEYSLVVIETSESRYNSNPLSA